MNHFFSQVLPNKVPEITLLFWVIKLLSTTVGETAADYLIFNLNFGLPLTTLLMSGLLALVLARQIFYKRYRPFLYWSSVVIVSIVGTLITDNLTDNLSIPLKISTLTFTILLALIFFVWYKTEKTLSIHAITTRKRELFYWATILATFALGTAAGDWFSEGLNIGYAHSALIFAIALGVIYATYKTKLVNPVLAFWLAYIVTRPFGAAMGDWLSQPISQGGLGLGATLITIICSSVIALAIAYLEYKNTYFTSST